MVVLPKAERINIRAAKTPWVARRRVMRGNDMLVSFIIVAVVVVVVVVVVGEKDAQHGEY